MKLPIVLSEHGDITVFTDKESAEQYLEPQDITNAEYEIFDASGDLLCAKVKEVPAKRILGMLGVTSKTVEISDPHKVKNDSERLRDLLAQFLARVKPSFDKEKAVRIADLIDSVLALKR
jgi:hypothetical protein